MSRMTDLAAWLNAMDAARLLAPDGVQTESAPCAAGLVLCDEGEVRAVTDVAGRRTAVRAYALYFRTNVLTQAQRAAAQDACEELCAQIAAAKLPTLARAAAQDVHCAAPQLTQTDDTGFSTYRLPLWLEVREA